jgi:hypothetical protein
MGVAVKRVGASAPQLLPLMPQLQACRCGATNGKFGPRADFRAPRELRHEVKRVRLMFFRRWESG